jgi:hypothetical protein
VSLERYEHYEPWMSVPGPEALDRFLTWWLADLADRFPGRHFRLVDEQEGPPVEGEPGARDVDPGAVRVRDDSHPASNHRGAT